MRFRPTAIEGFTLIELEVHRDARGGFCRTFCEAEFAAAGIPFRLVQANLSFNPHRHTLRGLHFQTPPHTEPKIVSCIRGRIYDVAVDLRPVSPTYLRWEAVELRADAPQTVYLAAGLAHGFLSLESDSIIQYFMGAAYAPEAASGVRWDDPAIGIEWPAEPSVISERDLSYKLL